MTATELNIRLAAFRWLEQQVEQRGSSLPRRPTLEQGFPLPSSDPDRIAEPEADYHGRIVLPGAENRVSMMAANAIFTPAQCTFPLTITSTLGGPHEDAYDKQAGVLRYNYSEGRVTGEKGNRGLRQLIESKLPLVYFYGLGNGNYFPFWPAWVVDDKPEESVFYVVFGEMADLEDESYDPGMAPLNYRNRIARERLHQPVFRDRVLRAYEGRCALCRLKQVDLLDAAHIKPYSEEGPSETFNGLSLCSLHHRAYDNNLLGIHPDGVIAVPERILKEKDGPTLKHSLVGLNGEQISIPEHRKDRPNRSYLEGRWNLYKETAG